jgi:hypothetical protein
VEWDDARSFLSNLRSLQETGHDVTWVYPPSLTFVFPPPPLSLTLFLTLMSMCQVGMPPPGIDVSTPTLQSKLSAALATHHCVPVFLEQNLIDLFIKVGLISQHII